MRASAERDVALIESSLSTLLRRQDAGSRAKANELAPELARRLDDDRYQVRVADDGSVIGLWRRTFS